MTNVHNLSDNLDLDLENLWICRNLTDLYMTGSCLITWVFLPILCIIGLTLNVVSIIIFCIALYQRHSRSSMTVYLIALSIFDSIQLFFSIFIISFGGNRYLEYHYYSRPADKARILLQQNGNTNENETLTTVEELHVAYLVKPETYHRIGMINSYVTMYFYPLLMSANYGSIWIVTLICVQRYFAVCFPLAELRTRKLKGAVLEVVGISLTALVLNGCRFWEFQLAWDWDSHLNRTVVYIAKGPLRNGKEHPYFVLVMEGIVYILLLYAVPFVIVSALNVRILMVITRTRRMLTSISSRRRREHRSALMVLAIILLFFVCYTLAVAERIWSILDRESAHSNFATFLNSVSNLMVG